MAFLRFVAALATFGVLFFAQPSYQQNIALPPPINEDLIAEGYIFIDQKGLERYRAEENTEADARAAVKKDVEYYLTEANTYYESLAQYGLRLQIRIAAVEILNVDLVSGPDITQGDVVEEKVVLDKFGNFLKTPARSGDNYDFALLFTGYNLSDPTAGYAQLGSMCENYARGIVELHGAFESTGVFAHEVGHIFGAEHDPDGSPYIMAPKASNEDDDKIYLFSALTADFILKNLRLPYRNFDCLRNTQASSSVPSMTPTKYKGKMQDINALCRRILGPGSTPCTSSHFYNNETSIAGDDMCFHVACRSVENPKMCITTVKTPEGMPCGLNKVSLLFVLEDRCILRVKWTNKRRNVSVLKEIGTTLSLQQAINTGNVKYSGHVLGNSRTTLMKTVCEGKLEGKRNRGRPPASLVSNLVIVGGMSLYKMVGASQDRDGWRKIVNLSAAANTAFGDVNS
ncbi:zinc metalloproteinase-disintegrin-like 4a [Elysia marginata]|uniref:Zinc metalloproteinase-disintegrin-like 4a n=1 Tax=Elysia marginata TaxID=1093978 RepID=A0AAV4FPP8_9GAST|nr:zinc metalloproteinase-disintegrin-like 4a [Elysia marginata]